MVGYLSPHVKPKRHHRTFFLAIREAETYCDKRCNVENAVPRVHGCCGSGFWCVKEVRVTDWDLAGKGADNVGAGLRRR